MSRRVLVSCPLLHDDIQTYDETFDKYDIEYDIPNVEQQLDESELLKIIPRYDGVIAGDDEFSALVFEAAENLEVVVKWGIGMDNIDHEAAEANGVDVYNTPGAFAPEVADVTIGYAVMLTRRLHEIDREVRRGNWFTPQGVSLAGKTMGIVGVGSIGEAVARRAAAMGMDLLGYDPVPIDEQLKSETGLHSVELEALFDEANLVTLHCPLTDATRKIVDRDELDAIGPDGYLINTSRGELIDESSLVTALQEDRIAGAALDVFETEPLPENSPLVDSDAVILGSHNAQNTEKAVWEVHDRAVERLLHSFGKTVTVNERPI
jgi:D-3-phosphoglycerate dehydrogenase